MMGKHNDYLPWFTCEATGKRAYHTKAHAKTAKKRTPANGEQTHLSIFRCHYADHFHLGHMHPGRDREAHRIVRHVNPRHDR